jgi:hypothetical protein
LHDLSSLLLPLLHLKTHGLQQLQLFHGALQHEKDRRLGRNDLLDGMKKAIWIA